MSAGKALVPKLRFPEFEGQWSMSELGSQSSWSSGGTPSKDIPSYWGGDIPWISASSMHTSKADSSDIKVTAEAIGNGTKLTGRGTILLLVRGSMLFNRIPICIAQRDVAFNQDVKALKPNSSLEYPFLFYLLSSLERKLLSMVTGTGIGAGKLDTNELKQLPIALPTLPEQQKIAAFLDGVSRKLALLGEKRAGLEAYKRGVMQRLFSGQIRFTRRDGSAFPDWEQKPLCNHLIERKEFQTKEEGLEHISLTVQGVVPKSERYDRDFLVSDDTTKKYRVTRLGDLCYNPANLKFGVIAINKYSDGIFSPIYVTFEVRDINLGFLEAYITSWDFLRIVRRFEQGTVYERQGVSSADFLKARVPFPHPEEQAKIAGALSALDRKIEAVSAQIAQMEAFKKGLLQQMFV